MNNLSKEPQNKVQKIAQFYYSQKNIQEAIFNFCKNRETVANFNNQFFAKRPDCFDYPSDILNQAKSGATSFHCSEELWQNPLDIRTNMTSKEYNEIKIGWDFLIDIDSKYLDYSKIAARLLIRALEHHGVKNVGVKFSGNKGFHILVPWKSFPEKIGEDCTKDFFPEWPRLIAGYINEMIENELTNEILKLTTPEDIEKKGRKLYEVKCVACGNEPIEKEFAKYLCPNFKCRAKVDRIGSNRKEIICNSCFGKMNLEEKKKVLFCENCKINSNKSPENFETRKTAKNLIDSVDIVLVSPRHLFRVPYSLHEKTALSSIVLEKNEIENFQPQDADSLKITETKSFAPNIIPGEAKDLLLQSLDWGRKKEPEKKFSGEKIDIKGLEITDDMFPPIIKKLLLGISDDGRKRALSLLLSFFVSLEFPKEYIEDKISEWNKKNYHPLKEGYIKSQINWYLANKRLPPNYDKPIYKEFGINSPPEPGMKNPISYTIKMAMRAKRKKEGKKK